MKRSKLEKDIRVSIMMPIWIYTVITVAYILTVMFIPFGSKMSHEIKISLLGKGNIFNYVLILFAIYTNFRIRGIVEEGVYIVFVSIGIKFAQIVCDYFLLKNSSINFLSLVILLFIEVALSMIEFIDRKNFKYTYEKIV